MAVHHSRSVGFMAILMLLCQLACNQLTNSKDELPLQCGPDAKPSFMHWKIEDTTANDFEAVIYSNGQSKEAPKTTYGCIEIPADIEPGSYLLIRSSSTRTGAVIRLDTHSLSGILKRIELTQTEELQNETVSIQCQGERMVAGAQLFLKRSTQEAPRPIFNINRYILRDGQNNLIQEGLLTPKATSLSLDPNVLEGEYQLRTEALDAFNRNDAPRVTECLVSVDLTPPSAQLVVAGKELSLLQKNELSVSPGQELKFTGIDKTATQVFACLRKRQFEMQPVSCHEGDFLPVSLLTAPEEGIWDLYFFATDSLGQQSATRSQAIVVYHEDRVNEVNVLSKLSRLSSAAFDQLSAWSALADADRVLRRLSLKRERENTRWGFIGAFWELNKILKARWQKTFAFKGVDIKTSQSSRYWVADGFRQNLYIFEDETLKAELDKVYFVEVKGTSSIWTYSYISGRGAELRSYEGADLKTSWPASGDELDVSETGKTAALGSSNSLSIFSLRNPLQAIHTLAIPRGDVLFSNGDRYVFHRTDRRVTRIDLFENNKQVFYDAPDDCKIVEIATRKDQEFYIVSKKSTTNTGSPSDDALCGIYRIDFDSESAPLAIPVVPDSGKYKADQFSFSTENEQRFLLFGNRLGSMVYAIDMISPERNIIEFELDRGEVFSSVKSVSLYDPIFLLETTQSRYIMDFSNERMKKVNFGLLTDSCEALPARELLICSSKDKNKVIAYEANLDRQLAPDFSLKTEDSEILPAVSRKSLGRVTANVQEKTLTYYRSEQPANVFQLNEHPKALAISDNGKFAAVASENRILHIFSPEVLLAEVEIDEPYNIIRLQISDRGEAFVLLSDASGNKAFEIWKYEDQKLRRVGNRHQNVNQYYDALSLSPDGEYAVVYFGLGKMDFLVNRTFSLFDSSSRLIKNLEANNSQPTFSRDSKGLYLIRKKNVDFYSIELNQETSVAQNLAFEPYEIVEGDILIGTTLYKSYNLKTGETIGDGGSLAVIQDNYLAMLTATEGDVEVYSPDGKELILSYRPPESSNELISWEIRGHPESPYFQVDMIVAGDNLRITKVTKTYVTDSFTAQEWLNRWFLSSTK